MSIRRLLTSALLVGASLSVAAPAQAIPLLQLDIEDGIYNTVTETTVATTDPFTLYALLTPASNDNVTSLLSQTYYIAAALTPRVVVSANLGSFKFAGQTIQATADMFYGNPPFEAYLAADKGDLPGHGIYNTYFREFAFTFSAADRATTYNAEESPNADPVANASGGMYYKAFTVDTTLLNPNYEVHFDLYSVTTGSGADRDVLKFAPFSHDAQGGGGGYGQLSTPEPGALVLLGSGIVGLGLAAVRRRRQRRA
jgi:hypothetical protein